MDYVDEHITETVRKFTYVYAETEILKIMTEFNETGYFPETFSLEEIMDESLNNALDAVYGVDN